MIRNRLIFALVALALTGLAGLVIRQGFLTARVVEAANQADAARWTAMAQYYAALNANRQRALNAEAARWTAMAQHYAALNANRQRALNAEAARWTALAQHYAALDAANQAAAAHQTDPGACDYFDQEIAALRSVYVAEMGITVARSAHGVLGIDGGLSAIKDC